MATGDLGDALYEALKAGRSARKRAPRKRISNNPAKKPVNEALRRSERVAGFATTLTPDVEAGQLSLFSDVELGVDPTIGLEAGESETDYLAPPNSLDTERPRAREARYDRSTGALTVVFRNGGTYRYYGVPRQTWQALKTNRSFGQTLDRLVINQYEFQKVAL